MVKIIVCVGWKNGYLSVKRKEMTLMRYFSTFSGIGGFEIGIHNAWRSHVQTLGRGQEATQGVNEERERLHAVSGKATLSQNGRDNEHVNSGVNEGQPYCVGYSEIDKPAISVYEKNYPGVRNYGDITRINPEELPDFDCLVGGFPCQAFSIAGKRGGFDDTRGTLFFDLARILQAKRPRLFVFENVKGLLSHDNGQTFRTIIATIDELRYDCQWQVVNSKNHGVPQNRERVIIVGHLRGTPRPEVFPITGTDGKDIQQINNTRHDYDRVYDTDGISPTINTGQRGNAQPKIVAQRGRGNPPVQTLEYRKDNLTNTITSVQKDNLVAKTVRAGGRGSPHGSKQNWDSYEVDGIIRRLTPIECERLQGFPDNWTKYGTVPSKLVHGSSPVPVVISDTQRYKMCGNAVTTNVIQAVFEKIFDTK